MECWIWVSQWVYCFRYDSFFFLHWKWLIEKSNCTLFEWPKYINWYFYFFEWHASRMYNIHRNRIPSLKCITLYNIKQLHSLLMLVCSVLWFPRFLYNFFFLLLLSLCSSFVCMSASEPAFIYWLINFISFYT